MRCAVIVISCADTHDATQFASHRRMPHSECRSKCSLAIRMMCVECFLIRCFVLFCCWQVPAFETTNGQFLTESNAIAHFVANEQLRGKTALEQAQVQQWVHFAESEILPASSAWVFPLLGILPPNKGASERAEKDITQVLTILNQHLVDNTFLVGERVTLADINVFTNLLSLFQYVLEPSKRNKFVSVTRWFNTVLNQPQVKKVVANFKLAETTLALDPKKYAEFQAKSGGAAPAKAQKKDEKKEKKPAPAKKEKEVEPAEELDEAELALAAEPKSKDPFDTMPKGTFNYDDFKRVYSNEDEAVAIKYFWEKFDAENNSIWFAEYKYNDELTKVFMSCNLISGMFQRLDKMRKASFGSVCLFGEDNNSSISGVWVWRGQELVFPLSPDWQIDYDCYTWRKLDAKSDECKKLVEQYFTWLGTDSKNRKFNQGKIWK